MSLARIPDPPPDAASLRFTAHPPERGNAGQPVTLACGACCCCCCCCLHTIGGLIGGLAGTFAKVDRAPRRNLDPNFPFPFRRDEEELIETGWPPALLYWLLLGFLVGVTAVWVYIAEGSNRPEMLAWGAIVGLLILPGLQLGASLLACGVIWLTYQERKPAFACIGRITLWSFAGGMIGMMAMGGFCAVISVFGR